MLSMIKKLGVLVTFGLIVSGCAFADGLGDAINVLIAGGGLLGKLMWAVCIVVGIALIAAAFTQFQIHRRNPKLVPLTTPTLYLILGIAAIALPFLGQEMGFMSPGVQGVKGTPAAGARISPNRPIPNPNDIDAPLN